MDTVDTVDAPETLPHPAEAPPTRKRASDGLALLLVGILVGGGLGIGGARAITDRLAPTASTAPALPAARTTTADSAEQAAIKDVLRRANEAQAQAFAKSDPTAMRATATAAHYAELVQVNRDLAQGGVRTIELVNIAYGNIVVTDTTATATTIETWHSTYADGTTDQRTEQNDYALVFDGGSWKIDGNTQPNATQSGTGTTRPTDPQVPTSTGVRGTSRNWSGYVATGRSYTSVSGTWIVPQPDATVPGIDATWVGIGGANTTDLIQAGTEATVSGDGTVSYDAWTETLPQSTRTIALAVAPGDTVTASITEQSAGQWLIDMKNVTSGRTYRTTLRYASSKSSAEWVEEAPSVGRGIAPLDRFGTVRFTAGTTIADGARQTLGTAGAKAVTMANAANEPLAVPSPLGSDGASFSVTRTGASSGVSGGSAPRRRRG